MALTEEQIVAAFKEASPELTFLFDKYRVDRIFQAKLYEAGITDVATWASLVGNEEELVKLCKDDFAIDNSGLANLAKLAKIKVSWAAARTLVSKKHEHDAEAATRGQPKTLAHNSHQAMRDAYEQNHRELEPDRVPSRSFIEKKLDEMEKGEMRAECLTEVIAMTEDSTDHIKFDWGGDDKMRVVKVSAKASMPGGPELRQRLTLMGVSYAFLASAQSNCAHLKGAGPALFVDYLDYLLGKYCYGLLGSDGRGGAVAGPSW